MDVLCSDIRRCVAPKACVVKPVCCVAGAVAPRPYMSPVGNTSFIRLPNGSVVSTGPGGVRSPLLRMGLGGAPGSVVPGGMLRPPQISNYFQQQLDDLEEDDGAMTIAETFNNYKPSKCE